MTLVNSIVRRGAREAYHTTGRYNEAEKSHVGLLGFAI